MKRYAVEWMFGGTAYVDARSPDEARTVFRNTAGEAVRNALENDAPDVVGVYVDTDTQSP